MAKGQKQRKYQANYLITAENGGKKPHHVQRMFLAFDTCDWPTY